MKYPMFLLSQEGRKQKEREEVAMFGVEEARGLEIQLGELAPLEWTRKGRFPGGRWFNQILQQLRPYVREIGLNTHVVEPSVW